MFSNGSILADDGDTKPMKKTRYHPNSQSEQATITTNQITPGLLSKHNCQNIEDYYSNFQNISFI